MPAPTIAETLKFANLQMAAEALYEFNATLANANLEPGKKFTGDQRGHPLAGPRQVVKPRPCIASNCDARLVKYRPKGSESFDFQGNNNGKRKKNEMTLTPLTRPL